MRCTEDIKPRLVYVIWYDSVGWRLGWCQTKEATKLAPTRCETVAWLVEETKDHLIVASTLSSGDEVYSPLSIPKCTIEDWGTWDAELKTLRAKVAKQKGSKPHGKR